MAGSLLHGTAPLSGNPSIFTADGSLLDLVLVLFVRLRNLPLSNVLNFKNGICLLAKWLIKNKKVM